MAQPCGPPRRYLQPLLLALALLARPICSVRDEDDKAGGTRLPGPLKSKAEEQGKRRIVQAKAESPEGTWGHEKEEDASPKRGAKTAEEEGEEDGEGSALELARHEQHLAAKRAHAGEARQEEEDEKAEKESTSKMLAKGAKLTKLEKLENLKDELLRVPGQFGAPKYGGSEARQSSRSPGSAKTRGTSGHPTQDWDARHRRTAADALPAQGSEKPDTEKTQGKPQKAEDSKGKGKASSLELTRNERAEEDTSKGAALEMARHERHLSAKQASAGETRQEDEAEEVAETEGKPHDDMKNAAKLVEVGKHVSSDNLKTAAKVAKVAKWAEDTKKDKEKTSSLLELKQHDQHLATMRAGEAGQKDAADPPGAAPAAEAKAARPAAEDAFSASDAPPAQGAVAAAPAAQDAASASVAPPAQGSEAAAPAAQEAATLPDAPPAETMAKDAAASPVSPPGQGADAAQTVAKDTAVPPGQGTDVADAMAKDSPASPDAPPGQKEQESNDEKFQRAMIEGEVERQMTAETLKKKESEDEKYPRAMIEGEVERQMTGEMLRKQAAAEAAAMGAKRMQRQLAASQEAGASDASNGAEKALDSCKDVMTDPQGQPEEEWKEVWEEAGRDYLPEEEEAAFAKMGLSDSNMSASASCQEHPRALVIVGPLAVGKSFSLGSLMKQKALWLKEKASVWHHFDAVLMDGTTMRKEHKGYQAFMDKGLAKGCIASQAHKRVQPYLAKLESKLLEKATGENCKRNVLFPATCGNVKNCTWDVEVLVKRGYAVTVVAVAAPFKVVYQRAQFSHKRVGDAHEISDFVQSLAAFLPVMSVGNDQCILVNNTVGPVQAVMNFTCPAEAHFTRLNSPLSNQFREVAKKAISISGLGEAELFQAVQSGDLLSKAEDMGILSMAEDLGIFPKAMGEGAAGGDAGKVHVQTVNVAHSHRTLKAMRNVLGLGLPEDGNASNTTTADPGAGRSGTKGLGGLSWSLALALALAACLLP